MSLERYFADLISASGARELVLESDNASTISPPPTKKRILSSKRQLNAGPPNCPLRQVSRDDLHALPSKFSSSSHKRSLRQQQYYQRPLQEQQQQDTTSTAPKDDLKDFYNEVAPGLKRSSQVNVASKSLLLPPRKNANLLLAPGVMSELFQLPKLRPLSRSTSDEPKKSICQYLEEVQDVVLGNQDDMIATLNDRRWRSSHTIPPLSD
eukprot:CAMPEP_0117051784 /NCGR_PEP_ID=MMETSP0472-20121206/35784_1 /TAXON_ID=693140 ORGANISM="Tiarina fusus, Strain LIS" /NCGR_SAMPLE_ID=MMETSP0472 /ASSEMBLY_ACC=CAM_ASM_000603 /LENGTH=208 /DNA_ID=CAMNT_0004766139 /DNA_START=106 /DNA_END=732 /DNA_ORIENTATION=-